MGDIFRLLKGRITLAHLVLILLFVLFAVGLGIYASPRMGTLQGTIALSFATAFATAAIVDLAYNYVVMKEVEEMVATHLMLNKDVQDEILKKEKVSEILHVSMEKMLGQKLAAPFKEMIDTVAADKDLYVMTEASFTFNLKNSKEPLLKDFFEVDKISTFNMTLKSDKAVFYATDSDDAYKNLFQSTDPSRYFTNILSKDSGKILKKYEDTLKDKFLNIPELSIDDESIIENSVCPEIQYDEDETVTIKIAFDIPKNIFKYKYGKVVRVRFKLKSVLWKYEHFAIRAVPRAYPRVYMSWDFSETDIEDVKVCHSFLGTQPEIEKSSDGMKITILVRDWVLPNNLIVFIWRLKGEKGSEEKGGI